MTTRWQPTVEYVPPPVRPGIGAGKILRWVVFGVLAWLVLIMLGLVLWAGIARASTPLFTVAEQHNPGRVTQPHRFSAIIGYPKQCVAGIVCWQYQKGTRSRDAHLPESWYLHQDGRRVVDHVFHLYVMDPRSAGWQHHVASVCAQYCFLDGMGASSLGRTTPHLRWTAAQWVSRAALVVRAVVHSGKHALPNSVGFRSAALVTAAGGVASTESFTASTARERLDMGRIWVAEIGGCLTKYHAFLHYRGRGDHFACYENGALPWNTGWLR